MSKVGVRSVSQRREAGWVSPGSAGLAFWIKRFVLDVQDSSKCVNVTGQPGLCFCSENKKEQKSQLKKRLH